MFMSDFIHYLYYATPNTHNKPTLEGLKKNNFPANSTIQKKKYFFSIWIWTLK